MFELFNFSTYVLQTKNPTLIEFDSHEYIFEGFSIFSHYKLDKVIYLNTFEVLAQIQQSNSQTRLVSSTEKSAWCELIESYMSL